MKVFSKVYLPNIDNYKKYIDKIYKSGWVTNDGKLKDDLETRLKQFLNVKNVILVANGSLGLQIAYKSLNLSGKVITTPFSYVATSNTLVWEGLEPQFVDINLKTLNIDEDLIEKKIDKKTSAILPVHVFGNPCNVEKIAKIAKKNKLKITYDASHAFNTTYRGQSVLNYGDISVISFHATKIFHTIEGGALVTNNDKIAEKIRMLVNFGKNKNQEFKILGINAKMNEFQAAMGLCNLREFNKLLKVRKKIWNLYLCKLKNYFIFQEFNKFSTPNFSYFPLVFFNEKQLKKTVNILLKNKIQVRRYFYPSLSNLSFNKKFGKCKNSNDIAKKIVCLPISHELDIKNQNMVINLIINSIKAKKNKINSEF